jgi:hypothetical protein
MSAKTWIFRMMRTRLEEFALSLHPEKTRLIEFGRHAAADREQRGMGKPETFNFLGSSMGVPTAIGRSDILSAPRARPTRSCTAASSTDPDHAGFSSILRSFP